MAYNMEVNPLDPEVAAALEASLPEDDILRLAVHKRVYLGVLAELQATGNTAACATLLSSGATGTGYFLRWMGGADWRYRYRQGEFLEALRHRLLQAPFPLSGDLRCPSCPGLRFRDSPWHALDCESTGSLRIWRHNIVRNHLKDLLQTVYPDAAELRCERFIGGAEDGVNADGRQAKADIFLRLRDGQVIVIDVVIANPAAPKYIAKHSDTKTDVAAIDREASKRRAIEDLGLGGLQFRFIPFAIEATGRLGPAALQFLQQFIPEGHIDARRTFCMSMSATIARFTAKMVLKMRATTGRGTEPRQQEQGHTGGL